MACWAIPNVSDGTVSGPPMPLSPSVELLAVVNHRHMSMHPNKKQGRGIVRRIGVDRLSLPPARVSLDSSAPNQPNFHGLV